MLKIYLTNLAAYNAGSLKGEWLELPMSEEDLASARTRIGGEEQFITDYEANFSIGEYDSVSALNEFADGLADLDEQDQQKVYYLIGQGYSREDALEKYEDVFFYPGQTLKGLAYEFVEEGLFGEIPEAIANYIDYEAIARDLQLDYNETKLGVFRID